MDMSERRDDKIAAAGAWASEHSFHRIINGHDYTFTRQDDDLTGHVCVTVMRDGSEIHHFSKPW